MSIVRTISEKHDLLAVHLPSRDSKRIIIKCFDAKVSLGSLKYTLSAKYSDLSQSDESKKSMNVESMVFSSGHLLACIPSANAILVFDLSRGVLSQTLHIPSTMGELVSCVARISTKDDSFYCMLKKEGKTIVLLYDLKNEKEIKMTMKVKTGSVDEDEVLSLAIHPKDNAIAVRMGKKIKLINLTDGSTIAKCKVKSASGDKSVANFTPILHFTPDGKYIITNSSDGLHYISCMDGDIIGYSTLVVQQVYSHIYKDSKYVLSATDGQKVSLIKLDPSNIDLKTQVAAFASGAIPNDIQNACLEAFFSGHELMMQQIIATGFSNVDVQMSRVGYRHEDNIDEMIEGSYLYTSAFKEVDEVEEKDVSTKDSTSKKRKSNVVLGAGESGGEAMSVSDLKRSKLGPDTRMDGDERSEDVDDFVLDNDDGGTTIAQRLALLSSELERDTEDEEDLINYHKSGASSSNFVVKTATADSLVILLRQALSSNDDTQLEVALQVADKKVIENSIMVLNSASINDNEGESDVIDSEIMITLLTKLVTRISRKPARAQQLSFWIRTVLVALLSSNDGKMDRSEREIASKLAPLRNMLSERVESLPAMLRLEGRLNLLGKL